MARASSNVAWWNVQPAPRQRNVLARRLPLRAAVGGQDSWCLPQPNSTCSTSPSKNTPASGRIASLHVRAALDLPGREPPNQ